MAPEAQIVVEALSWLAGVGEFWMLGYLIIRGVRRSAAAPAGQDVVLAA